MDVRDPDAELKNEMCRQLAIKIQERMPESSYLAVDYIYSQLLRDLRLELLQDQIDEMNHRDAADDLLRRVSASAFGQLVAFGRPVDELVKDSKHRRRIVNAAITVAEQFEVLAAELNASPSVPIEALSGHYMRYAERTFRARNDAFRRICAVSIAFLLLIWLVVAVSPLSWIVGIAATIGTLIGSWWTMRHFDPHDHS